MWDGISRSVRQEKTQHQWIQSLRLSGHCPITTNPPYSEKHVHQKTRTWSVSSSKINSVQKKTLTLNKTNS